MKKGLLLAVGAGGIYLLHHFRLLQIFRTENMYALQQSLAARGALAPLIYIALFALATVLFVPGLPITLLAGSLFGGFWGGVYVVLGSTIGVNAAFLIGRYLGRDYVQQLAQKNERMRKLDDYIKERGNTILIISRLVPVFPFNLQNYAYGITDISFRTYFWYSLIFMLPGTFLYTALGALAYSGMSTERMMLYASILLILLCALILLPKRIFKISTKKESSAE